MTFPRNVMLCACNLWEDVWCVPHCVWFLSPAGDNKQEADSISSDIIQLSVNTHSRVRELCITIIILQFCNSLDSEVAKACLAADRICLRDDLKEYLPSSISLIPPTVRVQQQQSKTGHKYVDTLNHVSVKFC